MKNASCWPGEPVLLTGGGVKCVHVLPPSVVRIAGLSALSDCAAFFTGKSAEVVLPAITMSPFGATLMAVATSFEEPASLANVCSGKIGGVSEGNTI